jgi:integrase
MRRQGFPDPTIDMWFSRNKGGEAGETNQKHDAMWAKYSTRVIARGGSPYDFNISDILEYVTSEMKGLSAGSCKSFISMCSVTSSVWKPDEPPLSDHHMLKASRKALTKSKPPRRNKPATYYSLFKLFEHLSGVSSNDRTCPLDVLRDKLIVLLLIDAMCRSADVASINRDTIGFSPNKVAFHVYSTKESKFDHEILSSINASGCNPLIDTPTVLRTYLDRTNVAGVPIRTVTHVVGGKKVERRPLILSTWRGPPDGMYFALTAERVSKIALAALHACGVTDETGHSIRGAGTSKLVNLGIPIPAVCERARWSTANQFLKTYFRRCVYAEAGSFPSDWVLERLLRQRTTRVSS